MDKQGIPPDFYSFETNRPFERCIECDKYLLEEDTEYLIEKAVRNYKEYDARDVIFDYAICMDCAENLCKEFSAGSMAKIMQYFQENVDIEKRLSMIDVMSPSNLQRCMIKKTDANECGEYRIFAHCKGERLNMKKLPYLISDEAMDEILPLTRPK